ncbi:unnamed protein product [Orchesella dallaii]|uniref:C2H2-type domain-containing protein n=1 Tax=Orchesella dallaii TaxID=48710 RepID=A0ABP1QBN1_9HEXA
MSEKYQCDKAGCGYTTSRGYSFATHLRTHLEEKIFICDSCATGFADISNLKKHEIRCKGGTFPCKKCGLTFSSASLVTRHLQQSKQNLPFKCEFCCGSFKAKRNLTTHIMNKHPNQVPSSLPRKVPCSEAASKAGNFDEDLDEDIEMFPPTQAPSKMKVRPTLYKTIYSTPRKRSPNSPDGNEQGKKQRNMEEDGGPDLPLTTGNLAVTTTTHEEEDLFPMFTQMSAANNDLQQNVEMIGQSQQDDNQNDDNEQSEEDEEGASKTLSPMNHDNDSERGHFNNQTLLLSLWKLTKVRPNENDELSPSEIQAVELLCLDNAILSPSEMAKILQDGLHDIVGMFPVGMFLFYYMKQLSLPEVVQFYNAVLQYHKIQGAHQDFIKHCAALLLQAKFCDILFDLIFMRTLPVELSSTLCFEGVFEKVINKQSFNQKSNAIVQLEEKVLQRLHKMIALTVFDSDKNSPTLLDQSFTIAERITFWNLLINSVRESFASGSMGSLSELVMLTARMVHDETIPYLTITTEDCSIPLHLHCKIMEMYGVAENVGANVTVTSTLEDVQDFIKYVYTNNKMKITKGCLSLGIFKLTVAVGVHDPWDFLLGSKPTLPEVVTIRNAIDVFQIAVILRREADVQTLWHLVKSMVSSDLQMRALNGLDPQQIGLFFDLIRMENEMEKYVMLLVWAYHKASTPLPAMDKVCFHVDVSKEFDVVKKLLQLKNLQCNAAIILRHCYITYSDIIAANNEAN